MNTSLSWMVVRTLSAVIARYWKCLILVGYLLPEVAFAQLTTDQVPRERTVPGRDQVKFDINRSRLRLGPIRLIPTVRVSEAGYDSNVFGTSDNEVLPTGEKLEKVSDWSATLAAGGRALLPLSSKVYLRGDALPQYTWYRALPERRTFGGLYQASLLGYFNRMSLEAGSYASKTIRPLNSETNIHVVELVGGGSANFEVELSRALSLFAAAEIRRVRYRHAGGEPPGIVDTRIFGHDAALARSGLRFRISPRWNVTLGAEGTRAEFTELAEERDNQNVAYLLGIYYDRPRFYVNLYGGYREGEPYRGSSFARFSTPTGSYFASFFWTQSIELQLSGHRRVVFSAFRNNRYFFETRNGAGVNVQVRPGLLLRAFADYGPNSYPAPVLVEEQEFKRRDNTTSVTGGFSVQLFRKAVLTALAERVSFDSNIPGFDRSSFRFTTGLSFEGEFSR